MASVRQLKKARPYWQRGYLAHLEADRWSGRGSHVTDVTNASRTMLMNLTTLDWDDEILKILGIPRQMLPRIVPSSDPRTWGLTTKNGPFGEEIPVCGDLGDQQAALVGQACYSPGEAKNTYGTAVSC